MSLDAPLMTKRPGVMPKLRQGSFAQRLYAHFLPFFYYMLLREYKPSYHLGFALEVQFFGDCSGVWCHGANSNLR